jgi:FtsH-binding integral membrane protein
VKPLAIVLAIVFFVLGILYGLGTINFATKSGEAHSHHISHLVVCWVIALLCLIWFRFQSNPSR